MIDYFSYLLFENHSFFLFFFLYYFFLQLTLNDGQLRKSIGVLITVRTFVSDV